MMQKLKDENLYQSLQRSAEAHSEHIALYFEGHKYSYAQFHQQVKYSINCLQSGFQLQKNDVIVLAFGNRPEFCSLFYAAMALGIIVVPMSTKLKADDSLNVLNSVQAKVVFFDPAYQPWLAGNNDENSKQPCVSLADWQFAIRNISHSVQQQPLSIAEVGPNDIAAIMYTSGTTGTPKGAAISHGNILHAIGAYADVLQLTSKDSTLIPIPICHITGLSALLCLFIDIGGTIHLQNRFHADEILDTIRLQKITFLHGSPTVFILLTQEAERQRHPDGYPSLRMIACGAGHLNVGLINKLTDIFPQAEIRPIYGLTETTSPASIFPSDVRGSHKIGSSGLPIPGLEFEVRDDNQQPLPTGETGHLWLKGPVVIKEYWQNPKANQQAFNNEWFYTGDIASVDRDNYVFIKDRSKDMINRGGEKIYSIEIENLISSYPGIKDIAIVPKRSEIYGEEAVAFIVANQDSPLISDNIVNWLTDKVAKFKIPSTIIFVSELPKNANGKTDKNILRNKVDHHIN